MGGLGNGCAFLFRHDWSERAVVGQWAVEVDGGLWAMQRAGAFSVPSRIKRCAYHALWPWLIWGGFQHDLSGVGQKQLELE